MSGLTENELRQQIGELLDIRDSLSQKLRAAQHEAEALASTVEALSDKLSEVVALLDVDGMTAVQWLLDNCSEIESLIDIEPEQHLRDIRAEAGRAGFIAGLEFQRYNAILQCEIQDRADYYADSIRQEKSYE